MRSAATFVAVLLFATTAAAAERVVVVTATAGFRHESIETAEAVIADIARETHWFEVVFARDEDAMAQLLSEDELKKTRVVMFVNTTGELALPDRDALFRWVMTGGSFIGVHSASDTWHESAGYVDMLGGEFESHPDQLMADVFAVDATHPSTILLESPHPLFEEYYSFRNFTPDRVHLLLARTNGDPLAWWRPYGAGRVFYTALGHRDDVWTSPWFRTHLTGALEWALARPPRPRRRPGLAR
jgi:type 1 glutamine amidotransferase